MTTTGTDTTQGGHDASAHGAFAPIDLPPVPTFGRAPLEHDPMERLRDEPPQAWQSPFPAPAQPTGYTYRVAPPPLAPLPRASHHALHVAPAAGYAVPTAQPAPAVSVPPPVPAPTYVGPSVAPSVPDPTADVVGGPSRVAAAMLVVLAVVLYWASGMAFSAALLAMASLVVLELARSFAARPDGASTGSKVAMVACVVLALFAALGAVRAMGGDGFVAGLFVLVAIGPTLLLLGGAVLLLRLRTTPTTGDRELRAGIRRMLGATGLLLVAGYHANKTFTATVDSLAAVAIAGLVLVTVVRLVRDRRNHAAA